MPTRRGAPTQSSRSSVTGRVPVVALTGHLGAGKTSLLNHLLRTSGARLGVIVNDFGTLNVDAALVTGQIDEAAAISGGCLCCLPDAGGLDEALEKLAQPRLRLDAILVEASGAADPLALARLIRFSGADRVRPGGIIEVIDAVEHFRTVDIRTEPPLHYAAATLVVVGKTDLLPNEERDRTVERVLQRVRERNADASLVVAQQGRIDPALVFDTALEEDLDDQPPLPLPPLSTPGRSGPHSDEEHDHHEHEHASAATVRLTGPVSPSALVDLIEEPPAGAYRLKGRVRLRGPKAEQGYLVNVVGRMIHVARLPEPPPVGELVAIGMQLDATAAQQRLEDVAAATAERPDAAGLRRLRRHRRLSD